MADGIAGGFFAGREKSLHPVPDISRSTLCQSACGENHITVIFLPGGGCNPLLLINKVINVAVFCDRYNYPITIKME